MKDAPDLFLHLILAPCTPLLRISLSWLCEAVFSCSFVSDLSFAPSSAFLLLLGCLSNPIDGYTFFSGKGDF